MPQQVQEWLPASLEKREKLMNVVVQLEVVQLLKDSSRSLASKIAASGDRGDKGSHLQSSRSKELKSKRKRQYDNHIRNERYNYDETDKVIYKYAHRTNNNGKKYQQKTDENTYKNAHRKSNNEKRHRQLKGTERKVK